MNRDRIENRHSIHNVEYAEMSVLGNRKYTIVSIDN